MHIVYGPWQVVIRGMGARAERRVLGTWEYRQPGRDERRRRADRGRRPASFAPGSSEWLRSGPASGVARRQRAASGAGASELWLLGASELMLGGSSEQLFQGASELRVPRRQRAHDSPGPASGCCAAPASGCWAGASERCSPAPASGRVRGASERDDRRRQRVPARQAPASASAVSPPAPTTSSR